jgi:hypothetical protein
MLVELEVLADLASAGVGEPRRDVREHAHAVELRGMPV